MPLGACMKIVVLDSHAVNPGDISWQEIEALGEVVLYQRTPQELVVERAKDADIIMTNKVELNADLLKQLDKLKYIGLLSTGYNVVDIDYCQQHHIPVCNIPAYSTYSVAQTTFALVLEVAIGIHKHNQSVKQGEWSDCQDFCYWKQNIIELYGKTIGIVGFGQIGSQVAQVAIALGMKVLAYTNSKKSCDNVQFCTLEYLLKNSDIISLHCPLNSQSNKMINKQTLALVKPQAIIVNTARGGLVDEESVAIALKTNKLFAYACDVLSQEPPPKSNPLLSCDNALITPHIAWASKSARERLMHIAAENIQEFLNGNVQNCVYKF